MNELIPSLLFFLAIFVAFAVIEFLIAWFLSFLAKRYLAFFIDHIIAAQVHYGRVIRIVFVVLISALAVTLLRATPLWDIYLQSTRAMKGFALVLLLEMAGIYWFTAVTIFKLGVERKIHAMLYILISLPAYAFIVIIAYSSYGEYRQLIQQGLIAPATEQAQAVISRQANERKMEQLKKQYADGGCTEADLTRVPPDQPLRHYIYLGNEPDYRETAGDDQQKFVVGAECARDGQRFWRTTEGQWYEVVSEE